jgi:hypothetical protein
MAATLLSELKPIILPPEPGLWPPAIGWWLVAFSLLMMIGWVIKRLIEYRVFWAIKRDSLAQAKQTSSAIQLNRILKITALHYFPPEQVARLTGQQWSDFLKLGLLVKYHRCCDNACGSFYQAPSSKPADTKPNSEFQRLVIAWLLVLSKKNIKAISHV